MMNDNNSIISKNIFSDRQVDQICKVLTEVGFIIEHNPNPNEAIKAESISIKELNLSEKGQKFWPYPMWAHQYKAVKSALEGKNVCISTSTSSGKSEIFQTVAIETVIKKKGKVLAFYCVKALNAQQQDRWIKTGLKVGIIDGNHIGMEYRKKVFEECDVVLMTPDAMHMILSNLHREAYGGAIKKFIKLLDLIIIDEVHIYRGVFGSNAAYLFRRINNLRRHYRKDLSFPQYITASATIPNPAEHSSNICGVSKFVNIGPKDDKSPSGRKSFYYVKKDPDIKDSTSSLVAALIQKFTEYDDTKTITFVSGRQQTGNIAIEEENLNHFEKDNKVYPFRAGFEDEARERIFKAMSEGDFKGIISTSALEIGIDISGLNIAIIANMPFDRNSYYQRIGRVGRGGAGNESAVIIVKDDSSLNSCLLFSSRYNYNIDKILPDLEPALHLEAESIMAIHAACHVHSAMDGCELPNLKTIDDDTQKYFPLEFVKLMKSILSSDRPTYYDDFVNRINNPHKVSLRNFGVTYQIVEDERILQNDTVTRTQQLIEAYKGALRNSVCYNTKTGRIEKYLQRITSFPDRQERLILSNKLTQEHFNYAKRNCQYTKPYFRIYIRPNFSNCKYAVKFGNTVLLSLKLYESTRAYGYYECFGRTKIYKPYEKEFHDEFPTTGVLVFNPKFNEQNVSTPQISRMIFEAFLLQRAFERNDIEYKGGRIYQVNEKFDLNINDQFLAIYDNNKLNVTKELLDRDILNQTFSFLKVNIDTFSTTLFENPVGQSTKDAVISLCDDILKKEGEDLKTSNDSDSEYVLEIAAKNSKVRLHIENPTEDEIGSEDEIKDHIVVSIEKDAEHENCVTYTLFDGTPNFLYNIPMDRIEFIKGEPTAKFDWKTGVIIK